VACLSTRSPARTVAVRLTDLPIQTRMWGARTAAKNWPNEKVQLYLAALFPSDTVYYVKGPRL
jgi:hypothetical protein